MLSSHLRLLLVELQIGYFCYQEPAVVGADRRSGGGRPAQLATSKSGRNGTHRVRFLTHYVPQEMIKPE